MDIKKLIPIISIVSVVVMMLWGFIGNDWGHSWLAVFVGGCIIAILSILKGKDADKKDKDD